MNERIEELYKQSFIEVQDENSFPCMTFSKQKFAELIVRECAEHALTFNNNIQSLNDKEIRSHSSRVSDYIKDRMGVEE